MAKPASARQVLTPMLRTSSPETSSRQNAATTADGAGSTFAEIRPRARASSFPGDDDREGQQPADRGTG